MMCRYRIYQDDTVETIREKSEAALKRYTEEIARLRGECAEPLDLDADALSDWTDLPKPWFSLITAYVSQIDVCALLIESWYPEDPARVFQYYDIASRSVKEAEELRLPVLPSWWMSLQVIYYFTGKACEQFGRSSLREKLAVLLSEVNTHKNDEHLLLREDYVL